MEETVHKSKCSYRVKQEFVKNFSKYLERHHGIIDKEHQVMNGFCDYMLTQPAHVNMNLYPQDSERDPWDMRFNFTTSYKYLHESDFMANTWRQIPMKEEFKRITSRPYQGIFREELTQKPDFIINELRKRKINFLGIISYDGTVSRQEFLEMLRRYNIWVVYVNGISLSARS